ncbi:MAG: Crp/Fnr family transcriptional regulator [Bacteroidota bacterium]
MQDEIVNVLNSLNFESKLIEEIRGIGYQKKVKEGQVVVSKDRSGGEMPFVMDGLLKVIRPDEEGNEVFLYYLEKSDTCAMSITCCMEGTLPSFRVVAESDATLWMVPTTFMNSWVANYPLFRRFVFRSYQTRFDELLHTVDALVFKKMNDRLYKYLLDTQQATGSFTIQKTHDQIAKELNTSRVVVSRLLKQMEREEKIEQHRNRIEIL